MVLSAWAQSTFYVSPSGKETGDGSIGHPLSRLASTVEKARTAKGDGNDTRRLSIKNYPGEKAVLSGGIPLTLQWEPYKKGILKAKVDGEPVMDMLIADGQIRPAARYPNFDEEAVRFNGTSAQATAPERVKRWKNPTGGYLHAMHRSDWGDFHYRITGKNKKGELAMEGGWQNNRRSGLHPDNRMVENIFEELDAPGEWFYDAEERTLYYYPVEGEQVADVLFESPQLKHLIEFRGTEANPVRNITLEGLELTQTRRTFMEPYEPLLRSDWMVYRGAAVFLDDGSSNYHIYSNLCLNGGIKLREGFYRVVENNIMINNSFHPHVWFINSGDVFTRNIVMTGYKPIGVREWGLMVDYNIFTDSLSYAAARNNRTDEHSIVASVQFGNPSKGDFTVADDSEAIVKGGFRNFETDRFGVVSPRLKAMARTPEMPTPVSHSGDGGSDITLWHGAMIKSLQTLGERSATGMDSERGVYVVSVNALGSDLRDYLRPNDAIIQIGTIPVNNLREMQDALRKTDKSKEVEFIIFRNQKENKVTIPGKLLE